MGRSGSTGPLNNADDRLERVAAAAAPRSQFNVRTSGEEAVSERGLKYLCRGLKERPESQRLCIT